MTRLFKTGLRARLLLILLPMVIIPMVVLGYLFFRQQAQDMAQQVSRQSQEAVDVLRRATEALHAQAESHIALLAQLPQVRQYFLISDTRQRNFLYYRPLLETFRSWLSAQPAYEAMWLLSTEGHVEVALNKSGKKEAHDTRPPAQSAWFKQLKQAPPDRTFRTFLLSAGDDDVLVARAISGSTFSDWMAPRKEDITGYLVLRIGLENLAALARDQRLGSSGFLVLLTPDLTAQNASHQAGRIKLTELARRVASNARQQPVRTHFAGADYLIGLHELPMDLKLMTAWSQSDTMSLAHQIARTTLTGVSLTIIVAMGLLFIILNRIIIRPIEALRDLAYDIGHNRLHTDNPALTNHMDTATREDEIGELARAFQDMNINLRATSMKLHQIAYEDSLTGLANRHMFITYLKKSLAAARRHHRLLVIMYIDIDGFKEVNDTLGHDAGDRVLREIAQRIQSCLRDEDLVSRMREVASPFEKGELSRIGGDEFAIILTQLENPADIHPIAERLLDVLRKPFTIDAREYQLGASIGVAMYPHDGEDARELLKRADIAMYQAKQKGKGQVEFYSHEMEQRTLERQTLLQDLRTALVSGQFELHYQPQLNLKTGRIDAVEALLRWKHPEQGYISPARFIPVAEYSGLIVDMGRWVLNEACRAARRLHSNGLPWLRVAVNFSTVQFHRTHDIVSMVRAALTDTGLAGRFLEMEITETAIMQSGEIARETLLRLNELGVSIAMDDFGTGYSSLATLRDLPIDVLKIDKSFTDGILHSSQGKAIVRAIMAMTRELGLQVVAEGVEQAGQVTFYEHEGCHLLQGYHISRPMPEADLANWIRTFDPGWLSKAR